VFRGALRDWLAEFFPPEYRQDDRRPFRRLRHGDHIRWLALQYAHGWRAPAWPREYGGMGLSFRKQLIYFEEFERAGVARVIDHAVTMLGPILFEYGTDAQKKKFLPPALACEHVWAQGYSEPNAGSDLASLRTRADRDGDHFVVNGQKIWTSLADDATHMYLLARTGKGAKKQQGISFLLVDLATPGITLRPIRNLAGHEEFCQVFFDDVRVPRENLVGEQDDGWTVAKALLGFERLSIGSPRRPGYAMNRLEAIARAKGLFDDAGFVDRFTALKLDLEDGATLYGRFVEQVKRGEPLGQDVSMLKVWTMETWQRLTELLIEAGAEQGVVAGVQDVAGVEADFLNPFYYARPATIYGGSSEIQRNILAKYVLKLPG
jgi:alkylation response protein AidB-like acyl-CoA dehydrogenase